MTCNFKEVEARGEKDAYDFYFILFFFLIRQKPFAGYFRDFDLGLEIGK